jgi:hypothetical protein
MKFGGSSHCGGTLLSTHLKHQQFRNIICDTSASVSSLSMDTFLLPFSICDRKV